MSTKEDPSLPTPKHGSENDIISFAKEVLAERTTRCTYITLKRLILERYTESSFKRHKTAVQTMLEQFHKRLTPARPKKRSQALSPRTDGCTETSDTNTSSSSTSTSSDPRRKKAPKLYFYEMSEEDDKAAEGNRFIGNNDL
jgi:hypothetical protein